MSKQGLVLSISYSALDTHVLQIKADSTGFHFCFRPNEACETIGDIGSVTFDENSREIAEALWKKLQKQLKRGTDDYQELEGTPLYDDVTLTITQRGDRTQLTLKKGHRYYARVTRSELETVIRALRDFFLF